MSAISQKRGDTLNKGKLNKFKELFLNSLFVGFFLMIADFFYSKICNSKISQLCSSYSSFRDKYEHSLTKKIFGKLWIKKGKKLKAKNRIQSFVENSFFYKTLLYCVNHLLATKVKIYGIVLFIWGFCAVSAGLIKTYVATFVDSDFFLIYQGIALIVFAVPLLASRSDMGYLLASGKITGFVIRDVIGIKIEKVIRAPIEESTVISVLVGLLLGITSLFVDPFVLLICLIALLYVALVFHKPEFGVLVTVFTIPFLKTMMICAQIILVFFAFMCKVVRGKRSIKLDALDLAVLFFAFLLFLGGVVSASSSTSIMASCVFVCFMVMYFLITNLIKTSALLRKMLLLLVIAFFVCSLIGVYQNFFGIADTTWTDTDMFSDIQTRVVSTFENPNVFGEYLIMIMPMALAFFIMTYGFKNKSAVAVVIVTALSSLIFTWSRGAWLGLIFSLIIYFIIISRHAIALYFVAVAALPFSIPFLPSSIIDRFSSIGDMTDTSTSYRVYIWEAVGDMIGDWWLGGIGVGTGAFGKVYPAYALSGIEAAPHSHNLYFQIFLELGIFGFLAFIMVLFFSASKCFSCFSKGTTRETKLISGAALTGILAILVQGLTDYVWYNYRVFLIFWVVAAIMSAAINCGMENAGEKIQENELQSGGQNEKAAEIEISL